MTEIGAPVSVLGTVSASQAAKAGDCVVLGAGAVLDNPALAGHRREEPSYL